MAPSVVQNQWPRRGKLGGGLDLLLSGGLVQNHLLRRVELGRGDIRYKTIVERRPGREPASAKKNGRLGGAGTSFQHSGIRSLEFT